MKPMRTPRTVDISVTNRCNLKCLYCFHFTSAGDVPEDLPKSEWLQFFDELGQCGVMRLIMGGGEPFIRKDLKDLIDGVVRNRMRFTLLTNGTMVSDDMARHIASTGRCDMVQVSLDGASPETHDYCRGDGNFERAMRGIGHLLKNKVPVSVRVTIHKGNVNDLDNVAKLLLEELKLPSFSTNSASYLGLCRQNEGIVQLTPEDRTIAMDSLLRLNRKYKGRIIANAGPLAEAKKWAEMERQRLGGNAASPGGGYLKACGGVFSKIGVRADGVYVPCVLMSHIELGRINKDSLPDVWQNHRELAKMRERVEIPLSDFEFCEGCEYMEYCTGNCPALAYTLTGKNHHPSPDACLRKFIAEGGKLPDMQRLSQESGLHG